ncbi:MAG: nidogen-like domain-containing protein, partial [Ilumatobacteraceae bacterium]
GVLTDVVSVSAGNFHSCAVTSGDEVFCWGKGTHGRLGNGSTTNQTSPVRVTGVGGDGVLTDVVSVSAGNFHSCAVTSGDEAFCWGNGYYGQLGGAQSTTSTPIQVVAGEAPGRSKLLLGNGGGTLSWASSWFEAGDCVRFAGTGTALDTAGSLRVVSVVDGTGSIDIDGYDIGVAPVRGTGVFSDCVGVPSTISVATDQLVNGRRSVIVTWYRMPNYYSDSTTGDANTYQMVIIERGDDAFDVEFNYGSLTESQSDRGYSAGDGTRLPIGWFSKADGELVESHELAGAVDAADLVDEGARALVDNSLNSNVAGRYVIPFRSGSAVPEAWNIPAMDGTATFAPGFAPGGAPPA